MIRVSKVANGFLVTPENFETLVVEGTNHRTVAAKLGRAVIKALSLDETARGEEGTPDE